MEPIIINETLTAPDGTQAPLRIVVYDRYSRTINSMHSLVSPRVDHKWFIVAEVGAELPTEEFFGGPMAVFEGITWTRHTMEEDYQPLVNELRAQVEDYLVERFPADGIRHNRFADWEPVIISPMPADLVKAWREDLANDQDAAQTAFDLMNAGYEAAETAAHNVYHEVHFKDEIDAADVPGTPIPSREERDAWNKSMTQAEQDALIYAARKATLGAKRAGRMIALQRSIAKKKAAKVINLDDSAGHPLPSMDSRLIRISEGRTDDGALHRAVAICRDLVRLGHWDGRSSIRVIDAYDIYNSLDHFVTVSFEEDELVVRKAAAPKMGE